MEKWVALLPLVGFFLALGAFWYWSKAREAGIDADLQQRLWNHSKYQREYEDETATPLEVSEGLRREKSRLTWVALGLALLAAGCFGYALLNLDRIF